MDVVTVDELLTKDIKGKVICFPTDTVYGVGCLVNDSESIERIYELKERDYSKPLAILTGSLDINKYVKNVSSKAKELMEQYWPGALTLIFKKTDLIPDSVTSNLNTVGLRMPNSQIALKILKHFGLMATTSINISGMPPLNDFDEIVKNFSDKIDYIVSDREVLSTVSSTVVDATSDNLKVLRQGKIKIN